MYVPGINGSWFLLSFLFVLLKRERKIKFGVDDSWRVRFEAINKASRMGRSHKCTYKEIHGNYLCGSLFLWIYWGWCVSKGVSLCLWTWWVRRIGWQKGRLHIFFMCHWALFFLLWWMCHWEFYSMERGTLNSEEKGVKLI